MFRPNKPLKFAVLALFRNFSAEILVKQKLNNTSRPCKDIKSFTKKHFLKNFLQSWHSLVISLSMNYFPPAISWSNTWLLKAFSDDLAFLQHSLSESAKLRVLRAHVPTCLTCLRAYVSKCLACLRPHVPTCLACLRAYVPMCIACLRAHMSTCLTCSRANVSCVLTCSRVLRPYLSTCLACLSAHMPTCLCAYVPTCLRANVPRVLRLTCLHYLPD